MMVSTAAAITSGGIPSTSSSSPSFTEKQAINQQKQQVKAIEAAKAGDLRILEKLPDGAIRNTTDKFGSSLLHFAAGCGHIEICKYLLNNKLVDIDSKSHNNGRSALHWAARNGRTATCILLVSTFHAKVDLEATGQVTPLQLAIWQCHLQTAKVLVNLGAQPQFVNSWGCGLAHWIAKSPIYHQNPTPQTKNSLLQCCDWLFQQCEVPFAITNNHGQTPLHKAAYASNIPVVEYLVWNLKSMDDSRDALGNTAADCAERTKSFEIAKWLRRFASPKIKSSLQTLGLSGTGNYITPPPILAIRTAFLQKAKLLHPDRNTMGRALATKEWNQCREAYQLLLDWWEHPSECDVQLRILSRNAALMEHPQILWHSAWHSEQLHQHQQLLKKEKKWHHHNSNSKILCLEQFETRLISLLNTEAFITQGLPIAQLPKEYEKNWHSPVPRPRDYGCRKLIFLIQKYCTNVQIIIPETRNNQPVLYAAK